jgi:hypothetical protein
MLILSPSHPSFVVNFAKPSCEIAFGAFGIVTVSFFCSQGVAFGGQNILIYFGVVLSNSFGLS